MNYAHLFQPHVTLLLIPEYLPEPNLLITHEAWLQELE